MNTKLIKRLIDKKTCLLSGDGRRDNPGYNAKCLTNSLMDQKTNKIITLSVSLVSEAWKFKHDRKTRFPKNTLKN